MHPDLGPETLGPALASPTPARGDDRLIAENARLRAEAEALRARLRMAEESAALQGARAASLLGWAARNETILRALFGSTFWHVTAPLRLAARIIGGSAAHGIPPASWRSLLTLSAAGWSRLLRRGPALVRRGGRRVAARVAARLAPGRSPAEMTRETIDPFRIEASRPAPEIVAPRVTIVAELTVPQCAKYRVWQKQAMFGLLGIDCVVVDWRTPLEARSALQTCALAIFYRVPGTPEVLDLVAECRRLRVTSWWEVDDVIFDEAIYRGNGNLETLEPALREQLLEGVRLYRRAMLACDGAIASTPALATGMRAAGVRDVLVVENALDTETLSAAAAARAQAEARRSGEVVVTYGSGTRTHDVDFARAAPALLRLMRTRPEVRLRIVGELNLPAGLATLGDRIERVALRDFRSWLGLLARSDIAIAPLEPSAFNDAKSNIKLLEAAVVGVPAICSPRANFRAAIEPGVTGFLAETTEEWFAALDALAADARLRRRVGTAARAAALARYAPEAVAQGQLAPLVAGLGRGPRRGLRILSANVFFWPRSFGGATIVAEELAARLEARDDAEVHVFTSHAVRVEGEYDLLRYERDGMPIYSVAIPAIPDEIGAFDNPALGRRFAEVLRAVRPDVVHVHSVQGLSASLLAACDAAGIPYVVTVHDAWWVCARQFMLRLDGTYCFQKTIDLNACRACVPGATYLGQRLALLTGRLRGAALVLAPSRSHGEIYLANGVAAERLRVQPNGIRFPRQARAPRPAGERLVRFGYVGGTAAVKGHAQLRQAFEALSTDNWRLVMVDNTLSLGFPSLVVEDWRVRGEVELVPAYAQHEIDGFFDRIDVLLFPSQGKESFGLTVREALARDVWVIATDCGGPVEDLVDGVNGTVVPMDGRFEPLRDAIERLLADPDRLAGYRNPLKARLRSFEMQAEELFAWLGEVAARTAEQPGAELAPSKAPITREAGIK
jgi:glycosyltransferase involved in cell wall biosynthesis